jgi:acyl-CoA-binding protein
MVAQTADFKKAVEDSRKLKAKPSDDELLQVRRLAAPTHEGSHIWTDWNGVALWTVQAGYSGPSYRVV